MLLRLAWRNIWRNRNRTLITMAAVWCAVLLSSVTYSLQLGTYDKLISNVVSYYSGYLQVQNEAYNEEQIWENSLVLDDSLVGQILSQPDVSGVTPRIQAFALASAGEKTRGCMVTGIEPTTEDEVTRLREKVVSGEYLDDASQAVMVAEGLAERLHLKVGDTLVLLGQGYYGVMAAGKYPIAALLEFGSPDLNKRMVYMPIGLAQQWLGARDEATALVVLPRSPGRIEQLSASLNKRLPEGLAARTWMELMPDIVEFIRTDKAGGIIVLAILYVLISFGIFATLLMMFAERRRELGMLVALGMKKGQLALMILYESIFINLTGCIFGILVSIPIIWYLAEYPIRLGGDYAKAMEKFNFEPVLPASTDPGILLTQALIVLVISSLLALYPIYKVLTMEPIKAMRA